MLALSYRTALESCSALVDLEFEAGVWRGAGGRRTAHGEGKSEYQIPAG
jgi:hypothetical protein